MSDTCTIVVALRCKDTDLHSPELCLPVPATGSQQATCWTAYDRRGAMMPHPLAPGRVRACVNDLIVRNDDVLRNCHDVAVFPPASGG